MLSDANDAQRSEWFAACSDDGTKAFPYGDVEDVNACNTAGGVSSGGVTADAGYYDECEGGVLGLFDMVGNAEEWEGSCDNFGGPAEHSCALRGGAFWSDASDWGTCAMSGRTADRGTASHDWGFRCCGDLP
jgi:formylglycine-generating enzyme required for sulfatase activity